MSADRTLTIGEIVAMLAANMAALAPELLPGGKRRGHEWVCGSPAGEPGTQMAVRLSGAKAGIWAHFAGSEKGDALDLIAASRTNGDKSEALKWARAWLGLSDEAPAGVRRQAPPPDPEAEAKALAEIDQTREAAKRIWLAGQPDLPGTPVAHYLAARGIDLAEMAQAPRAIRYHPNLWHRESRRHWPAMVTAISGPGGWLAVHRTWLEITGPTSARKAPIDNQKMTLGVFRGGHIPLCRGRTGRPLRKAEAGEVIDITEGIEDGLSVALYEPDFRVIAAVSLGNLAALDLPPAITTLRIWRQADTKLAAIKAFDRAISVHRQAGRTILIPDLPKGVKDVNDMITRTD